VRDVDDAKEEPYRVEAGRTPLERQRRCAHAVHGLCGCAAPSGTLEVRIFRKNKCPLGRRGGVIVECDTNVTGGLRHGIDVDGDDQITRDGYEERVESECVVELDVETTWRRSLFIYLELGEFSTKVGGLCGPAVEGSAGWYTGSSAWRRAACAESQSQQVLGILRANQKAFDLASGHKT